MLNKNCLSKINYLAKTWFTLKLTRKEKKIANVRLFVQRSNWRATCQDSLLVKLITSRKHLHHLLFKLTKLASFEFFFRF